MYSVEFSLVNVSDSFRIYKYQRKLNHYDMDFKIESGPRECKFHSSIIAQTSWSVSQHLSSSPSVKIMKISEDFKDVILYLHSLVYDSVVVVNSEKATQLSLLCNYLKISVNMTNLNEVIQNLDALSI